MSGFPALTIPFAEGGLPPQHIWKTSDEYTTPTDLYFTIKSEKIVLQGHPYFKSEGVPLVSPQQWRVFTLQLPEPNNFNISQQGAALTDVKYIWQLKGFKIQREGPIRAGVELNKNFDPKEGVPDKLTYDVPAQQHIIVGCQPTFGVHYEPHNFKEATTTPYLVSKTTPIQDGDLSPSGFGNLDIAPLLKEEEDDLSPVSNFFPLTMLLNPDFPSKSISEIANEEEETGDRSFFHISREQSYSREFLVSNVEDREVPSTFPECFSATWNIPSGSVLSSLNDIFNKRYWINRGEHQNNCLAWNDVFYFTCLDNTRGWNFVLPTLGDKTKLGLRHIEIFQIECVVRLVKVKLEAELIQYLYRINKDLLNRWGYGWKHGNSIMPMQHHGFQIGPQTEEKEESEDEENNFRSIGVDFTGRVHSDLGKTDVGRHYKQYLNTETFTGKKTGSDIAAGPKPKGAVRGKRPRKQ